MSTSYTIVRYVPDPIADEAINIGLIAYDGVHIDCQFLERWDRVRHFSPEKIDFLEDFARQLSDVVFTDEVVAGAHVGQAFTPPDIESMSASWKNCIQFTPPRATLLSPHDLVSRMAAKFLVEPSAPPARARDRRHAVRFAFDTLRHMLLVKVGEDGEEYLKRSYKLAGKHEMHSIDVAVANGQAYGAAQGLSFEAGAITNLRRQVDATKWVVDDLKQGILKDVPFAIVALPAVSGSAGYAERSELFHEAKALFEELGAAVVNEAETPAWASGIADTVLLPN